jgi:predicted regulator of Ras-like GTPase activity (Roadblock/LC7/MglB family)
MKLYNLPIKTFNPDKLLKEMLNAEDGTVFVLGEKLVGEQIGDNTVELTMCQIKKVTDRISGVGTKSITTKEDK